MPVKPIPDGYHSITPYLIVEGAARVIDFMKQAFGAHEMLRMPRPDGTIAHAEVKIGDSIVMIADGSAQYPAAPAHLMLYVPQVDETYRLALSAGARSEREPSDQFYGDRTAGVIDSGGNSWYIATHVEDVPEEELNRRAEEWARKNAAA